MSIDDIVPVIKFREAFTKVGWKHATSSSGKYEIWTDNKDESIWTRLPLLESDPEYRFYQNKNILFLLYALGLPENKDAEDDLKSQLKDYNYKLVSRIIATPDSPKNTVPYEVANIVTQKNVDAFRFFHQTKSKKTRSLPIEKFQLNHTEVGSFVIPVSILVDDSPNSFFPVPSQTNLFLHQYLDAVEKLASLPRKNPTDFAERVMAESIDSKIVKDFFGNDSSIARCREKYAESIDNITITTKGSPFLDFGLEEKDQSFKEVSIGHVLPLKEDYIDYLEQLEIRSDTTRIDIRGGKIDVAVEAIDINGHAKFSVVAVNGTELSKPFKAYSTELSKKKLDMCADYIKRGGAMRVIGDLEKLKGKSGKILIDDLSDDIEQINLSL